MSENFMEDSVDGNEAEETEEKVVNTNPKLRWYVVQAFSGYEGRVQKTLVEHIGIHGLEEKFGEILVPTEEVIEMRAGQKLFRARMPRVHGCCAAARSPELARKRFEKIPTASAGAILR